MKINFLLRQTLVPFSPTRIANESVRYSAVVTFHGARLTETAWSSSIGSLWIAAETLYLVIKTENNYLRSDYRLLYGQGVPAVVHIAPGLHLLFIFVGHFFSLSLSLTIAHNRSQSLTSTVYPYTQYLQIKKSNKNVLMALRRWEFCRHYSASSVSGKLKSVSCSTRTLRRLRAIPAKNTQLC